MIHQTPAEIYERAIWQALYVSANTVDYKATLAHVRFLLKEALVNGVCQDAVPASHGANHREKVS